MIAPIVGIDLGTTFSVIAIVNRHGKAEVISNREGEDITPSVVLFDGARTVVGSSAKRAGAANPLDVVQFVKRQMGVPHWSFVTGTGQRYSAEEVSALILKRLKVDAETKLGVSIHDAVITVPAYFDDAQRKATQDAGRIAGLNVLRIINEPTAAALAYGAEKIRERQTLLVYDLGGGTFDVTVMRIEAGKIDVIATGGDKNLGGFDWDNLLMMHLNEKFMAAGGPDLFEDPASEYDLRDKAEICKKNLSNLDPNVGSFPGRWTHLGSRSHIGNLSGVVPPAERTHRANRPFVLETPNSSPNKSTRCCWWAAILCAPFRQSFRTFGRAGSKRTRSRQSGRNGRGHSRGAPCRGIRRCVLG